MQVESNSSGSLDPQNLDRQNSELGAVMIFVAICIAAIVYCVGLAIDTSLLELRQAQLKGSLDVSSLRASQMYYEGRDISTLEPTMRGLIGLNLKGRGISTETSFKASNETAISLDVGKGIVVAESSIQQPYAFAAAIPGAGTSGSVGAKSTATLLVQAAAKHVPRKIFAVVDMSWSMDDDFVGGKITYTGSSGEVKRSNKKYAAAVLAIQSLIQELNGEELRIIGFANDAIQVLPFTVVDDLVSSEQPNKTNREFALSKAADLEKVKILQGSEMVDSLSLVLTELLAMSDEERRAAAVIVIADGNISQGNLILPPSGFSSCVSAVGATIEIADKIRELGSVVHSLGVDNLRNGGLFSEINREFLLAIAGLSSEEFECIPGLSISPSRTGQSGTYHDAINSWELVLRVRNIGLSREFLLNLPRRL